MRKQSHIHLWVQVSIRELKDGSSIACDRCSVCKRKKKRHIGATVRKGYGARRMDEGQKFSGVKQTSRGNLNFLPVVFRGFNTAPAT